MRICFFYLCLFCSLCAHAQGNRYNNEETSKVDLPRVTAPIVPNSYTLFGEKVPLTEFDIRERFDKELIVNTFMQGSTTQIIKQMSRWFPIIEARLKANGIPEDFKYLAVAESALTPAVSRVGASGFWQFMKATGPSYGLEVNDNVDERYHVLKSTDAACKYLKDAYAKFNNWTAAAASYNCGMGGYNGAATNQGTYSFYNLYLPEETMRYIFRIMALKYILENPTRSGYNITADQTYKPYKVKVVPVTNSINSLVQFALENGTTYKMVKLLNPWLRDKTLKNTSGKLYEILLPEQK